MNHVRYDGRMENNFAGTSLHLSFSGYQLAIDVGTYGQQDQEAFFVEAIVSVHDRGHWIADIDIMRTSPQWAPHKSDLIERTHENESRGDTNPASVIDECAQSDSDDPVVDYAQYVYLDEDYGSHSNNHGSGFDWVSEIKLSRLSGESNHDSETDLDVAHPPPVAPAILLPDAEEGQACNHSETERTDYSQLIPLISIDSWAELMDPPLENAVVRATNNRVARLCTTVIAVQQGFNVHVAESGACWQCSFGGCCSEEQHNLKRRANAFYDKMGKGLPGEEDRNHSRTESALGSHHLYIC